MANIRHVLTLALFAASLAAPPGAAFADNSVHTHHKHKSHAGSTASPATSQTPAPCGAACDSNDTQGGSAY
ncbi:MAG: hypothetical protein ABSC72_09200 [Methylovirgula sp.]|jgi:hypothetical protein